MTFTWVPPVSDTLKGIVAHVVDPKTQTLVRENQMDTAATTIKIEGLAPWTLYEAQIFGDAYSNRFGQGGGLSVPATVQAQTLPAGKKSILNCKNKKDVCIDNAVFF